MTSDWFMNQLIKLKKIKKNKISSIGGPKWMVRNYINGIRFRLDDFICGILNAHSENNFISVAVLSRHLLETIAHSHYILNTKIRSAINEDNKEKYFKYLKSLMILKDINNEGEKSILYTDRMESAYDGKLLHISDALRNFKKHIKSKDTELHAKDFDSAYNHLSQLSHPNPMGIMYFYKKYDSREIQDFAEIGIGRDNLFVSVFIVFQHTFTYLFELEKFQELHDNYCINNDYDKKYN